MYTEQDMSVINARIRKNLIVLTPILLAILAVYVYALSASLQWLAMAAGPLLFVATCYGILAYLWPNMRYRSFLQDMDSGLSRDMKGTIVEISDAEELQDGARVLPVRVRLDPEAGEGYVKASYHASTEARRLRLDAEPDDDDERIVYLNVSKRQHMPAPGTKAVLHCFGRHIKSVEC